MTKCDIAYFHGFMDNCFEICKVTFQTKDLLSVSSNVHTQMVNKKFKGSSSLVITVTRTHNVVDVSLMGNITHAHALV